MKRAKTVFVIAALLLLTVSSFATENAFMGFDVGTQKMYAVVTGDAPFHARISYTQSNPDGYLGNLNTYVPEPVELWGEAELSPTDPGRYTDLPDNTTNVITAYIDIYNNQDQFQYRMSVSDTLLANVNNGDGFYTYRDGGCSATLPDSIRRGQSFCAWICHGSYTIPVTCENPGYDPDLLQVSVANGCAPIETHCDDASCPRVDTTAFRWFKRVFPNCRLYLTMTYCNASPGCVCIWRSDFFLPVQMTGFTATAGDGLVNINWSTASETGTNNFIVTRSDSRDGVDRTVYSVDAAGSSATHHDYSWTDMSVQNGHTYYYKLHVTDANGNHVYNVDGHAVIAAATPNTGNNSGVPTEYSVKNYPNPFNSNTTFTFSIPLADRVTLKVYDLLGREVSTVVNRYMPASTYNINWSADGLPTGVYMYKLTSGQFSYTSKLLYIK